MLQHLLSSWLLITLSLWVATLLLPKLKIQGGIGSYLIVAGGFGLLNVVVGELLFVLLGVLSLGFFFIFEAIARVLISAILLKVVDRFSDRLRVGSFGTAIVAAIIMAVVGVVARELL